jgi:hypothetical protein
MFDSMKRIFLNLTIVGLLAIVVVSVAFAQMTTSPAQQDLGSSDLQRIADEIPFWESHTRYCVAWNVPPFPGKENVDNPEKCEDQDMTLFNGLLCSVHDPRGCDAVKRAQGGNGQWWRSPRLVGIDRTKGGANASMSEEQTWGTFLYLLESHNKSAFENWVKWISDESRPCELKLLGHCALRGLPQWCKDTTQFAACNFLPYECTLFKSLAEIFYGNDQVAVNAIQNRLGCNLVMRITGALIGTMTLFSVAYTAQEQVDIQASDIKVGSIVDIPITSPTHFYAIHKIAVQIYMLQLLHLDNDALKRAANKILAKSKTNPFFVYLAKGAAARGEISDLLSRECPTDNNGNQPTRRTEWAWERSEDDPNRQFTSYWDCIFAAKLIVSNPEIGPNVVLRMQAAQAEAVQSTNSTFCENFSSSVVAELQSSPIGNDYQVAVKSPTGETDPQPQWYQNSFVAPCAGRYLSTVSIVGDPGNQGKTRVDLVSTYRYGQPYATLQADPNSEVSTMKSFHLEQYEAVSLVLHRGTINRSIASARVTIKWCRNQDETLSCS